MHGTIVVLIIMLEVGVAQAQGLPQIDPTPGPVSLVSPLDGERFLYPDSIIFKWRTGGTGVTRYWFELGLDTAFLFRIVDSLIIDTTTVVSHVFNPMYHYYWRVRARNAQGWGQYSQVRQIGMLITSSQLTTEPKGFFVEQNYPNPFNPTTIIRYSIAERTHVSLSVYSVLGRQVARLLNSLQEAGLHEVTFNGAGLATGMYYYRFEAHGMVQTRRFNLVK